MDKYVMKGRARQASEVGSRASRRLRAEGLMPINIYGASKPNTPVVVNSGEFYRALEDLLTGLEVVVRRVLPDDKLVSAVMKCDDWNCVCFELGLDQTSCGRLIQELRQEFKYGSISLLKLRVLTRLAQLLRELSRRVQESS